MFRDPFQMMVSLIVAFTALPVHEAAHAYVASKLGDDTAKYQGRLTLNPFVHLDLLGTVSLALFGFGWAKPVPINPRNFKNPKLGMMLSSLAGPVSNILLALVLMIVYKVTSPFLYTSTAYGSNFVTIIYIMVMLNTYLAVFNLLPIPPLDGSRLLTYFLPAKYYFQIMQYERYIWIGLIVLLYTGVLSGPLMWLSSLLIGLLDKMTFFL